MEIYNYQQHVTEDIIDYLQENYPEITKQPGEALTYDDFYDKFYDRLFNEDAVTGNGSGSYTFNTIQAEQNLVGNWELLREAVDNISPDFNMIKNGAEACDVLIRIYVLPDALCDVYNKL